ncbi:hypothetical protein L9F63_004439, partial [Diploptera punctata]
IQQSTSLLFVLLRVSPPAGSAPAKSEFPSYVLTKAIYYMSQQLTIDYYKE